MGAGRAVRAGHVRLSLRSAARSATDTSTSAVRAGREVSGDRGDGLLGVPGRPAQVDQAGPDLVAPQRGRRRGGPGAGRRPQHPGRRGGRAQPPGQFQHDPLRALAADPRHPGQRGHVLRRDGLAQPVRAERGQHGQRQPRARPRWPSAPARTRPARRRWRSRTGSARPRGPPATWPPGPARRCAARPACPAWPAPAAPPRRPRSPRLPARSRRPARPDAQSPQASCRWYRATTGASGGLAARRPPAGSAGRATGGRWPGPGRRPCPRASGGSASRSSRITMAVTWALSARPLPVTAALTSLGVCSATGRPRPRRAQHGHRARLRGAHHGAHVVLAEHPLHRDRVRPVLGQPGARSPLPGPAAGPRCPPWAGSGPRPPRPGPAACPGRRPPHRARTGSAPGPRRAPAFALHPGQARPIRAMTNMCSVGSDPTGPGRRGGPQPARRVRRTRA